jgi:hypothetical protein
MTKTVLSFGRRAIGALALGACLTACDLPPDAEVSSTRGGLSSEEELALAYDWAPIHVQDVWKKHGDGRADYITRFNYDGNWKGRDNWDNLDGFSKRAAVYYGVSETATHYFIQYVMFHPRDWVSSSLARCPAPKLFEPNADASGCWTSDTSHENDFEGTLVVVRKDGGAGRYEGMVTMAHGELLSYGAVESPYVVGEEGSTSLNWDPWKASDRSRPCTRQEAAGHGMTACSSGDNIDQRGREDSIVYLPTRGAGETPPNVVKGSDSILVRYELVPMTELWAQRHDRETFGANGAVAGDCSGMDRYSWIRCAFDAADAPWTWGGGEWSLDPAKLVRARFRFTETVEIASQYLSSWAGPVFIRGLANRNLDLGSDDPADGTPVSMWTPSDGAAQHWSYRKATGEIVSANGKCLTVKAGDPESRTPVVIETCNGGLGQQWSLEAGGAIRSALGRCLDVTLANTEIGGAVWMWDCNGGDAQRWKLSLRP